MVDDISIFTGDTLEIAVNLRDAFGTAVDLINGYA
jgi:hypothetical protein